MEPLSELTIKDVKEAKALQQRKYLVGKAPVLAYCDARKALVVQCNASEHELGAAILEDGISISFARRALAQSEVQYV